MLCEGLRLDRDLEKLQESIGDGRGAVGSGMVGASGDYGDGLSS